MSEDLKKSNNVRSVAEAQAQVAKGAGLTGIGSLFEGLLRYVSMILVTNYYGRAAYGVFGLAMYLNEMGQRISSAGLHDGVMRYVAMHESHGEEKNTRGVIRFASKIILLLGSVFAIGLALFAPTVAEMLDKGKSADISKEMVIKVIRVSCLALPTTALLLLLGRTLSALKKVGAQVFARSFILPVSRVTLIVAFLWLLGPQRLDGLAWAIVVSTTCACIWTLLRVNESTRICEKNLPGHINKKEFLRFSVPLIGVDIAAFLALTADIFLLAHFGTQEDMGTYQAILRLIPLLAMPLFLFSSMLTPLCAELYERGKVEELQSLYKTTVRWIFTASLPLAIGLCLFINPLLSVLGEGFIEGSQAFLLLAIVLVINGFGNPSGYAITMAGHSRITLLNACIMTTTVVITGWFAIPEWGVLGAAIARASGIATNCILTLTQGWWLLGLNPWHRDLCKPAAAGALAGSVAWIIQTNLPFTGFLLAITASLATVAIYGASIVVLKLSKEDRRILEKINQPIRQFYMKARRKTGR